MHPIFLGATHPFNFFLGESTAIPTAKSALVLNSTTYRFRGCIFVKGRLVTLALKVLEETLERLDQQVLQDHLAGFALHVRPARQVRYSDCIV